MIWGADDESFRRDTRFKGDDALDEFSYFIVLYIPSRPWFLAKMLPKFLLTF